MVLSILFVSLTQRQKSSAYNSNLAQAILKRQWNSCSLTYNQTISTKLCLLQKEEYLNHVYGYDAVFSQSALFFFSFLANVILAQLQLRGNIKPYLRILCRSHKCYSQLIWKFTIHFFAGSEMFTLTMRTVIEKAFISMYISLREHCIAVTQLKVTVCHIFISQMKIYKKKENLSINISIKSRPVFLSASRSSVAKATSVPKVYPSRRRRSGYCSMITGFAGPKTILKQIFKRLIIF